MLLHVGKHLFPSLENITSYSLVWKEGWAVLLVADKNSLEPGHLNKSASINHRAQYVSLSRGVQSLPHCDK